MASGCADTALCGEISGRYDPEKSVSTDNDVPPRDAEYAHEAIAGAQLLWIDKASHIGFWVAEDAYKLQKYALDWLREV
jgi:pimeloyl-ACP methyl ester carboxylesterase